MKDFKPMLARVYTDQDQIDWGDYVYMQPKLDGVRCLFTKDGAFSRTGKQFMNIKHIEEDLKDHFITLPWLVLDGELYNHNLRDDFEKIISLVRKQKPTDEDRSEARRLIQYHVYDYTDLQIASSHFAITQKYRERMHNLNVSDMYTPSVHHVAAKLIATPAMIKVMHAEFLKQGYEGSIIRLNGLYEQKRSKNLLKVKDFSDSEAKIIGFVEGKGKRVGTIGKFIGRDSEGMEFGMPVMDNFKFLQKNFNFMKKWVGKTATFKYFEKTKRGSYRHPLFKCLRNYE
jgi:ATP-dependent DNA ligase